MNNIFNISRSWQDLDVFMKHLNQPLRNNKSGNHGNDDDKSVTPSDAVATEADDTGEASPAIDDSNVDIEIILPDYPRSRPNTKSAKFSDVDIVNLSPGAYLFVLLSFDCVSSLLRFILPQRNVPSCLVGNLCDSSNLYRNYLWIYKGISITLAPGEECDGNTFGSVCLYFCLDV